MMFEINIKQKSKRGNFNLKLKFFIPVSLMLFILKLLVIN